MGQARRVRRGWQSFSLHGKQLNRAEQSRLGLSKVLTGAARNQRVIGELQLTGRPPPIACDHQSIHAQTLTTFIPHCVRSLEIHAQTLATSFPYCARSSEHPCPNPNNVRSSSRCHHQSIYAKTLITSLPNCLRSPSIHAQIGLLHATAMFVSRVL